MRRGHWVGTMAIAASAASACSAQTMFSFRRIGTENAAFTAITSRPGDREHAFALARDGRVLVIVNGTSLGATPLLDFRSVVAVGGESGALGLAFDPEYAVNGHVYICHSTATSPRYVIVRYTVSPPSALTADPATRTTIMPITAASATVGNHNGGWIGFGPDGYLYMARGEGPLFGTAAQDLTSIYGKILRIDVRGDDFPEDSLRNYRIPADNPYASGGGAPELWARGLRNPWRASFDRLTGDLWIGDVGSRHEEINRVPAGTSLVNFGYPCYDGLVRGNSSGLCADPAASEPPALLYARSGVPAARISTCVTGGVVYRGCEVPSMVGRYLYGQCGYGGSNPKLGSFAIADPMGTAMLHAAESVNVLAAAFTFGEDAAGEVYVGGSSGLYRMIPLEGTTTDCNGNGRADNCEIADGSTPDVNGDGLPDSCTAACPADFDASGALGVGDIFRFLGLWFAQSPLSDFNADAAVSLQDLFDFLSAYFDGCP